MIHFNVPPYVGNEVKYIEEAVKNHKICGDGPFTRRCHQWLETKLNVSRALLTTSGTHALEMAALLCDIQAGDEVIMPSYTFVSTANAFVLRGAKIVFVDIRPDTLNINENLIENAITKKTKAIVVVHYAGVSCEMDKILEIANTYSIKVIEDAAQGIMSTYKGKALGAIGDYGCLSFHETKNISMGEGGGLLLRQSNQIEIAEIIREKGTNRSKFYRGEIDKYTWVAQGSSYLPGDLNAAYLWAQLEMADIIYQDRMNSWKCYYKNLEDLDVEYHYIERPVIPKGCVHNAHMFYIKTENIEIRTKLINYLKSYNIQAVFHYIPLHSSPAGRSFGAFCGGDRYTTSESERIIRLPLYYNLKEEDIIYICDKIHAFYLC